MSRYSDVDTAELVPGKLVMRVMDPAAGDLKTIWDPAVPAEVEAAREQFASCRKKGLAAFRVDTRGKKTEVMTEFDATAAAIIFAPAPVGG